MALALPGQLALVAPALAGAALLEQRLLSKLIEAQVPDALLTKLADKEVTTAALLGSIATER